MGCGSSSPKSIAVEPSDDRAAQPHYAEPEGLDAPVSKEDHKAGLPPKPHTESVQVIAISDFPDLSEHKNLMAQCLTVELWRKIRGKTTLAGSTVDTIIQTGVDNPGCPHIVGCVAGDEESYDTFAELFNPVIELCHNGYKSDYIHHTDMCPDNLVGGSKLDPNYVLSCRIRSGRNIRGYSLPPRCTRAERRDVESILTHGLCCFESHLKGKYYPLNVMSLDTQDKLIADHYLFPKPTASRDVSSGITRDWPDGRGIWHNEDYTFIVWINQKDHCRVISMEKGGNMKAVFDRFCTGLNKLENCIRCQGHEFMWNNHLGYINTCPSNLGTGLRAGVFIKLPKLSQHPKFNDIIALLRLQIRDVVPTDGIFDISNMDRLGSTEVDQVQWVVDGVERLIELEKKLEAGECINDCIPCGLVRTRTDFPDLKLHYSLMAQTLTPAIYYRLRAITTPSGFTLSQAIQCGIDNPGSPSELTVGCVAGDEETYIAFADLFNPVLNARHKDFDQKKPQKIDLDPKGLQGGDDLDPRYIQSVRIRAVRSVRGFSLPPHCCRSERRTLEELIIKALGSAGGDLHGKYYSLKNMTDEEKENLRRQNLLFEKPSFPITVSSGMARDWPDARGIWYNEEKNFMVWVNEKDHCRIVCMEAGSNITEAFTRFCDGLRHFEEGIKAQGHEFMWNEQLGFIVTCPYNIGTGMSCSVHMKLAHLSQTDQFNGILYALGLQKNEVFRNGEATPVSGEYEISNSDSLGTTELQQLQSVIDGVKVLTEMEKLSEKKSSFSSLMPINYGDHEITKTPLPICKIEVKSSNMPELSKHSNWMATYLTEELYEQLKDQTTLSGFTFDQLIQPGVDDPGHPFFMAGGVAAGCQETYTVFAPLLDLVIEGRHSGYTKDMLHQTDLDPSHIDGGDDLDTDFVLSCRVRAARSIEPLGLPPQCTRRERREVEHILVTALRSLKGNLEGTYYPLKSIKPEQRAQLVADNFLFDKPEVPVLVSSGMVRDWPDARGVWHNKDKTLLVWVNKKDHARIISMQKGGNMKDVFERFCEGLNHIEASVQKQGFDFMYDCHLGHIVTCPSNLGTSLRASVHIKLPNLGEHEKFGAILEVLRLEKRSRGGLENMDDSSGIYDICNLDRLGSTEVVQVQRVIDGVKMLTKLEKALMAAKSIDDLIPEAAKNIRLPDDSITKLAKELITDAM